MIKEYKEYLFVKVPGSCCSFRIDKTFLLMKIDNPDSLEEYTLDGLPNLPSCSWQIIGKGDEIDWEGIVEREKKLFYTVEEPSDAIEVFLTTTESGHSLLRSYGMEPSETLVLKKE